MIFTGESGLGKSYVSFLVHYIYTILGTHRLANFFKSYNNVNSLLNGVKSGDTVLSIPLKKISEWINKDAIEYIGYLIGHDSFVGDIEISWPFGEEEISFTYREEMAGLSNKEDIIYNLSSKNYTYKLTDIPQNNDSTAFETLVRAELSSAIFGFFFFHPYLLPPSRGALMELVERPVIRSGMYDEFFNLKSSLARPSKIKKRDDSELDFMLQKVNNGNLTQSDNEITYITSDGVPMPLTAAASSVKELAPFTMMLNKFPLNRISIMFEEPEAHLHPERQQHVADIIGYAISNGCHMQITTHSDYFIKRLNLLIKLYTIWKRDASIAARITSDAGINGKSLIDPNRIGAYYLVKNEDGSSRIEEFDVIKEDMIPFSSFQKVITDDFNLISKIANIFENED